MTLLNALKGSDGLVLAADSRGTFGDPRGVIAQNDAQQKAHILALHVAVLTAGSGEVGALIIDLVRQKVADQKIDGETPVLNVLMKWKNFPPRADDTTGKSASPGGSIRCCL